MKYSIVAIALSVMSLVASSAIHLDAHRIFRRSEGENGKDVVTGNSGDDGKYGAPRKNDQEKKAAGFMVTEGKAGEDGRGISGGVGGKGGEPGTNSIFGVAGQNGSSNSLALGSSLSYMPIAATSILAFNLI